MVRRFILLLMVGLLLPVLLVACGGDDKNVDNDSSVEESNTVDLSQIAVVDNDSNDLRMRVNYPSGWISQTDNNALILFNNEAALAIMDSLSTLDEPVTVGTDQIMIVLVIYGSGFDDLDSALMDVAEASDGTVGDAEEFTPGEYRGLKAEFTSDRLSGVLYLYQVNEFYPGAIVFSGTDVDVDPIAEAIFASTSIEVLDEQQGVIEGEPNELQLPTLEFLPTITNLPGD